MNEKNYTNLVEKYLFTFKTLAIRFIILYLCGD